MGKKTVTSIVSPFIQSLREDTNSIISVNPCSVQVMRKVPIYDEEEIISVESSFIGNELIRISELQTSSTQALKPHEAIIQYYKSYHITAQFDADIQKGDILIRGDGERFIVQDINTLYVESFSNSTRYRKIGTIGLFKE